MGGASSGKIAQSSRGEQTLSFLDGMGLGFGAFDFIETPHGGIVFLGCNPSGQFSWLEEQLGLPISAAIADELTLRARRMR